MGGPHKIFLNLEKGKIRIEEKNILIHIESVLRSFFTRLYSDVKDVYYKLEMVDDD